MRTNIFYVFYQSGTYMADDYHEWTANFRCYSDSRAKILAQAKRTLSTKYGKRKEFSKLELKHVRAYALKHTLVGLDDISGLAD